MTVTNIQFMATKIAVYINRNKLRVGLPNVFFIIFKIYLDTNFPVAQVVEFLGQIMTFIQTYNDRLEINK